jgi:hypothetical protein
MVLTFSLSLSLASSSQSSDLHRRNEVEAIASQLVLHHEYLSNNTQHIQRNVSAPSITSKLLDPNTLGWAHIMLPSHEAAVPCT